MNDNGYSIARRQVSLPHEDGTHATATLTLAIENGQDMRADAILDALTMGAGVAIETGKGLGDE